MGGQRSCYAEPMPRLPIEYEVDVREGPVSPLELRAGRRPVVIAGPPPEFGGDDHWWSPEHLFVSSVATCFAATLFALLKAANLKVVGFKCRAKGILGRAAAGLAFTSVELVVEMRALGDDVGRVRSVIDEAKKKCFVANSLQCPVTTTAEVHPS